jgi:hypothetical protein
MIILDLLRPVASLREALGFTTYAVGKALGGGASLCDTAERSGTGVQMSTLVRIAAALGGRIEVRFVRQPRSRTGRRKSGRHRQEETDHENHAH